MAAEIYSTFPSFSQTMSVGTSIDIELKVINMGVAAMIGAKIETNGDMCAESSDYLVTYEKVTASCHMTMPNETVIIGYGALRWNQYTDMWDYDDTEYITLTPEAPQKCEQAVRVKDKDTGAGIDDVKVVAWQDWAWMKDVTTSLGGHGSMELTQGESYKITAQEYPAEYECATLGDCEVTTTACYVPTVTLYLKKKATPTPTPKCEQAVRVKDKDTGAGIDGIKVVAWQDGVWMKDVTTSLGGYGAMELNQNESYKITAYGYPTEYECALLSDCEVTTTACYVPTVSLYLRKKAIPQCSQKVQAVDKDTSTIIGDVPVIATQNEIVKAQCSTSPSAGSCNLTLNTGEGYKIELHPYKSYPAGYSYEPNLSETITACTGTVWLRLTKSATPTPTPTPTPVPKCEQAVRVKDKDTGAGIDGVKVVAWQDWVWMKDVTTSLGGHGSMELTQGESYKITAHTYPAEYECAELSDCEVTTTACYVPTVTLYLKKKATPTPTPTPTPLPDSQGFVVIDQSGQGIAGAMICSGLNCVIANGSGWAKLTGLTYGYPFTVKATAPGYVCNPSSMYCDSCGDSGTSCVKTLSCCDPYTTYMLSLSIATPTPTATPPPKCDQIVQVKDKDTGAAIDSVKLIATLGGAWAEHCTTAGGGACVFPLNQGEIYKIILNPYGTLPAGYDWEQNAYVSATITACTGAVTLLLTKSVTPTPTPTPTPVPKCYQTIMVKDSDTGLDVPGVPLIATQNGVWVVHGTTEREEGCTMRLNQGEVYKLIYNPYGPFPQGYSYEQNAYVSATITACTGAVTLLLTKSVTPTPTPTPTATPTPGACSVSMAKDIYTLTETIVITYTNAPANSTLLCGPYPGAGGDVWTVSGSGSKSYTLKTTDNLGDWRADLIGEPACGETEMFKVSEIVIDVLVKDEIGEPVPNAFVDVDVDLLPTTSYDKPCTDADVVVMDGTCTTTEWMGDANNVQTDAQGVARFGMNKPPYSGRYSVRVGKAGYVNDNYNEDWTDFVATPVTDPTYGEYHFIFTLRQLTGEDKFAVYTHGFASGDSVACAESSFGLDCYVPLGLMVNKQPSNVPEGVVEFTAADGLEVGKQYGIGAVISLPGQNVGLGPSWCGYFGGTKVIDLGRYGCVGNICEFFGIDPYSAECQRFVAEFADPIMVADVLLGTLFKKDIFGEPYVPSALDYAVLPLAIAGSLPFTLPIPLGRLGKGAGLMKKAAKEDEAMRLFLDSNADRLVTAGNSGSMSQIDEFLTAVQNGDTVTANAIIDAISSAPTRTTAERLADLKKWADETENYVRDAELTNAQGAIVRRTNSVEDATRVLTKAHAEELARAANDVHFYRFEFGDDIRENLFHAAIQNAKRHETLTQTEVASILQLAHNNPENMARVLASLPDADYTAFRRILQSSGATTEAEIVQFIRAVAKDGFLDEKEMHILSRIVMKEPMAKITGTDTEIAEAFLREFPELSGERVLAEIRLMPDSFIKSNPAVVDAAVSRVRATKGISEFQARKMIYGGKTAYAIRDMMKGIPEYVFAHPLKALGMVVAVAVPWWGTGAMIWWWVHEGPQTIQMGLWGLIEEGKYEEARIMMPAYKDALDSLEEDVVEVWLKNYFPLWHNFGQRSMINHRLNYDAYAAMLGMEVAEPAVPETLDVQIVKIIDGDTFDVGVPPSDIAEDTGWRADLAKWMEHMGATDTTPPASTDLPIIMRIRFLGLDTIENKKNDFEITRQTDFKNKYPDSSIAKWYGDQDLYDEVDRWMNQHVVGGATLLSDNARQWTDEYPLRRFLAVPFVGGVDICNHELKLGHGAVRFYLPNTRIQEDHVYEPALGYVPRKTQYLYSEAYAAALKLGIWKFAGDTGSILCRNDQWTAVDVYLDDEVSPRDDTTNYELLIENVPVGAHRVTFKKTVSSKVYSCSDNVVVTKDGTANASCTMTQADKALFWINSNPDNARIYIDGDYKSDLTPANGVGWYLDPGQHTFKLTKSGYTTWEKAYTLVGGEEWYYNAATQSKTVPLTPTGNGPGPSPTATPTPSPDGKIYCRTRKPEGTVLTGAKIYLTGGSYSDQYFGETTKTITVPVGTYTLRYTQSQYSEYAAECVKENVIVQDDLTTDGACAFKGIPVTPGPTPPPDYTFYLQRGDNYLSLPLIPAYSSPSAAFGEDVVVKAYNTATSSWYTPTILQAGLGYHVNSTYAKQVTVEGTPVELSRDDLIASLSLGDNLVGVGYAQIDLTGSGYTALEYDRPSATWKETTLLTLGSAYWIKLYHVTFESTPLNATIRVDGRVI